MLYGATTIGRDLAPRIASRLKTGLTADCTKLDIEPDKDNEPEFRMTRPAFGGNLMATIICPNNRPQMSTVRPGVMQKMQRQEGRQGVVTEFAPKFDASKFKVKLVKTIKADKLLPTSARPRSSSAVAVASMTRKASTSCRLSPTSSADRWLRRVLWSTTA